MKLDTDRLKAAIGAVIRELFPNLRFYGCYAYRVSKGEGGKFSGKPERAAIGLPDLVDIPIRGPTIGGQSKLRLTSGASVGVMFLDGDPTRPVLAFGDDSSEPTQSGLKASADLKFEAGGLMEVNGAADFVALAQKVATELAAIKTYNDAHTHPTPWGPSGPPLAPMPAAASTACTKLKTD
jgi:hypothetical protein